MVTFDFCNDQPGRLIAVFVFSPLILWRGYKYDDVFLVIFALTLFLWDFYHIIFSRPNEPIYKNIFEHKELKTSKIDILRNDISENSLD